MANLVITKSGSSVIVDFGVYTVADTKVDMTKGSYHIAHIDEVKLYSDHVRVEMDGIREDWLITYDSAYAGTEFFIVDSVAGVAPTSESDLFDKITALR